MTARHYFDEEKAGQILLKIKEKTAKIDQIYPFLQPVIKGVINRKAFCEDYETRQDLVNDIWAGIIKYKLLEKWNAGQSRAFSYLTGIANRTLCYVLGDRNKRRKAIGEPTEIVNLDDLEGMKVDGFKWQDAGNLEALLNDRFPGNADLIAEFIGREWETMADFKQNCHARGFDDTRAANFITKMIEARDASLGGLFDE